MHFIIIALLFFFVYQIVNPEPLEQSKIITVSANRVEQLKQGFKDTWTRPPTTNELALMVDHYALDEIYAREANSLGLGDDDEVVRRRLRQKMEFLIQDMSSFQSPSESELQKYYLDNIKEYQKDSAYSFQQVYLMTNRTEKEIKRVLELQLKRISKGEQPEGDNSLLPSSFKLALAHQINRQFGQDFDKKLEIITLNQWTGPIKSGLGLHFIKVTQRIDGELPPLKEVKTKVLQNWHYQQSQTFIENYQQSLLKRYRIDIIDKNNKTKQNTHQKVN